MSRSSTTGEATLAALARPSERRIQKLNHTSLYEQLCSVTGDVVFDAT
jgi:hypothetical protein